MSVSLNITNFPDINIVERLSLAASVSKGATVLPPDNNQGVGPGDYLVVGTFGGGQTEIVQVSSIAGDGSINLVSGFKLAHSQYERVTKIFGNQLKVYVAANIDGTTPPLASFVALSGGTVNIDADQTMTQFTDPNGNSSVWYRYSFYNSNTGLETGVADTLAARGQAPHYTTIRAIRRVAGITNNPYISDGEVDLKRQAAEDEISGVLQAQYVLPLVQPYNGVVVEIATQLAAGMIQTNDYGPMVNGSSKDGASRMASARAMLDKIAALKIKLLNQVLVDTSAGGPGSTVSSYPDANAGRAFTTDQVY